MCGIVGYVGKSSVTDILMNGLRRLEYRGYDSAGAAIVHNGDLSLLKNSGKVKELAANIGENWAPEIQLAAHTGIAHTRWATHGPPTKENAHPHLDESGRLAMVHNGIIENYMAIRKQLEAKNHHFKSETDSEVLAHLIGEYYQGNLMQAVCAALKHIEGAFGIAVVSADEPSTIVAARRGSPIVIGLGNDETIVASDASAIVSRTRQVIYLDDDDVAEITTSGADVRNIDNVPVSREIASLDWDPGAAEKGGHEHFMLKEILEQPMALQNAMRGRLDRKLGTAVLSGLTMDSREISNVGRLIMLACGTSMHAGMVGKYYFEDIADLHADTEQAAEFRYRNPIITPQDMVIAISQSGETADTLAAVREAKQKGALVAGLCNVVGSTIARETGRGVYLHAGPEIGVASTKAFTTQVLVLLMMALKFGRCRRLSLHRGQEICKEIDKVPDLAAQTLEESDSIAKIAAKYAEAEDYFFIGRDYMYPVALEGALKLKEISYSHAEGYHAAELKHGPIALLEEKVPVVAMANDLPGQEKILANIQECKARHSPVIAVVNEGDEEANSLADDAIIVPKTSPLIAPIPAAIVLQLLAYHVARERGCDIDQPRNLAKSVTVE